MSLCIVMLALSLVSCGSGPDKALDAKLALLKEGNFAEAGVLEDSAFANEDSAMLQALYAKMDYTIGEAKVDGETATVPVTIVMVDMSSVFAAYMKEALSHLTDPDWDEDGSYFMQMLQAEDAETKEFSVTVNMVKTEDAWEIAEEGNDELADALTGGLISALGSLGDLLG